MTKSVSQKKIAHSLRNGKKIDPRDYRGNFGEISGVRKSTPTLVTKRRKQEKKHKNSGYGQGDHAYCRVSGL